MVPNVRFTMSGWLAGSLVWNPRWFRGTFRWVSNVGTIAVTSAFFCLFW